MPPEKPNVPIRIQLCAILVTGAHGSILSLVACSPGNKVSANDLADGIPMEFKYLFTTSKP